VKQSQSHIVSQFDKIVGTLLEDMGFRRGVFSSSPNGLNANGSSWSFVSRVVDQIGSLPEQIRASVRTPHMDEKLSISGTRTPTLYRHLARV
jgi:hypothetical protein